MGVFDRMRRGPLTQGDAVRGHLARATAGADAYTYNYRGLEVHAYFVDEPLPHILYCTFGVSEVASSQPTAGTQTELTLRTPVAAGLPPQWPADQLARLAGMGLAPGHHVAVASGPGSLTGFVCVTDPVLGLLDAPTGLTRFTYAAGLNGDDYERMLRWDPVKFAGLLGEHMPLGLTDPRRAPLSARPGLRERLDAAAGAEGSSIRAMLAGRLDVDADGETALVAVDAQAARDLVRAARYRLLKGRAFALVRDEAWLLLDPGATYPELGPAHAVVPAPAALAHELLAVLDAAPGTYRLRTAPLTLRVA